MTALQVPVQPNGRIRIPSQTTFSQAADRDLPHLPTLRTDLALDVGFLDFEPGHQSVGGLRNRGALHGGQRRYQILHTFVVICVPVPERPKLGLGFRHFAKNADQFGGVSNRIDGVEGVNRNDALCPRFVKDLLDCPTVGPDVVQRLPEP